MTRVSATSNGVPTDTMKNHYKDYSAGGWGLIIIEGTCIDEKFSQGYKNKPGIATNRDIIELKK
jgi:2,4-dienoyl-CoA reductase-like NADH-dependent reductase (Old Yellow Enzyme family)